MLNVTREMQIKASMIILPSTRMSRWCKPGRKPAFEGKLGKEAKDLSMNNVDFYLIPQ